MEIRKLEDIIVPVKPIMPGTGWEDEISPIIEAYALDFFRQWKFMVFPQRH